MNNKTTKKESKIYDYYLKASPEFYHNLYFKNFNVGKKNLFSEKEDNENNKKLGNNYIIFGQDTAGSGQSGKESNTALESAGTSNEVSERVHVYHILKHIKDGKIRMGMRKYIDTQDVNKKH
ncbi:hypothetical protein F3Y39_30475, partial [Klebsiella pneumoniae]